MNIYDIAKEAGVSIATISRVINGKSTVSSKTREKVEAVLKKYNYSPDPAAQGLAAKSSKSVAILSEDIREPYCAGITYAVERELSSIGYAALLINTGGTTQGVAAGISASLRRHADAAVVLGMPHEAEEAVAKISSKIPFILINNNLNAQGVYSVMCDETYGMMLAVGHLVGTGRSDIIFVQDSVDISAKKLEEGFDAGMAMYNLSSEDRKVKTERGAEGGFACCESLIREGRTFKAVICGDDTTSAGFIKCLGQNFLDVPEDISVVGFYNTPYAECCTPPLTTVDCRPEKVGAAAVKLLSDIFNGKQPESENIILPRLVRRESA